MAGDGLSDIGTTEFTAEHAEAAEKDPKSFSARSACSVVSSSGTNPKSEIGNPRSISAVLFDFDGTLVDAPIDFARMRRDLLRLVEDAGVDPGEHAERDLLSIVAGVRERVTDPERFAAAAEAALMAVELECSRQACEVAGASEVLAWLEQQDIRIGIVTRNCRAVVEQVLERIPLRHGVLLTRTEVTRVKPDPEHLLRALAHLDAAPEASVMVGDHWMDVQAGKAAGMATVGILTPGRPLDFFDVEPPDRVIRNLHELIGWISLSSSSTGTPATSCEPA